MTEPSDDRLVLRRSAIVALAAAGVLWLIKLVEVALGADFAQYGLLPRTLRGSIGILTSPLIHGDWMHLFSNTVPILMLVFLMVYFYHRIALEVLLWMYLATGLWLWIFARDAYHIGASGLVYALAAFLFFSGILRRDVRLMAVSGIVLFLYGGMIYGVFPEVVERNVSWEAHLLGAISGVLLAIYFRKFGRATDDTTAEHQARDGATSTTYDGSPNTIFNYTYRKEK
jgi:membrane associated rhomboid family serine protease